VPDNDTVVSFILGGTASATVTHADGTVDADEPTETDTQED